MLVVIALYIANFAGHHFSSQSRDWGDFGNYLGGTLGPIFGAGAFLAVLLTLAHQISQFDRLQAQRHLAELHALINYTCISLDRKLSEQLPTNRYRDIPEYAEMTVEDALSVYPRYCEIVETGILPPDFSGVTLEFAGEFIKTVKLVTEFQRVRIRGDLVQLMFAISYYQKHGGDESVVKCYKRRYFSLVSRIHDLLMEGDILLAYFTDFGAQYPPRG